MQVDRSDGPSTGLEMSLPAGHVPRASDTCPSSARTSSVQVQAVLYRVYMPSKRNRDAAPFPFTCSDPSCLKRFKTKRARSIHVGWTGHEADDIEAELAGQAELPPQGGHDLGQHDGNLDQQLDDGEAAAAEQHLPAGNAAAEQAGAAADGPGESKTGTNTRRAAAGGCRSASCCGHGARPGHAAMAARAGRHGPLRHQGRGRWGGERQHGSDEEDKGNDALTGAERRCRVIPPESFFCSSWMHPLACAAAAGRPGATGSRSSACCSAAGRGARWSSAFIRWLDNAPAETQRLADVGMQQLQWARTAVAGKSGQPWFPAAAPRAQGVLFLQLFRVGGQIMRQVLLASSLACVPTV